MKKNSKKLSKRNQFIQDIKVEDGELSLEELDKIRAGVPNKRKPQENER